MAAEFAKRISRSIGRQQIPRGPRGRRNAIGIANVSTKRRSVCSMFFGSILGISIHRSRAVNAVVREPIARPVGRVAAAVAIPVVAAGMEAVMAKADAQV